ncbi:MULTISPECIES: hypothetical protein [unclassified Alcanivorax]|uniref:hypothetical protein n=2 Tax=Alcanivorax TaxID=59753 RepID=UPI0012E7A97B|nr:MULTISPECIES: hypothetical protein [unclassified Alcanivorax]
MNMEISYKKTVIEHKDKPVMYYDGDSMGGGTININCGACGYDISKETFEFWKDNKEQEKVIVSKLGKNFNLPQSNQWGNTFLGIMSCNNCNAVHALHIHYGEVSNGHWQSSLHKVLLCNS